MTFFIRSGTAFIVSNHTEMLEQLPAITLTVMADPKGNLYLEDTPLRSDDDGKEIYGDVLYRIERVMTTFADRAASTGILLSGSKGSGKTLFARILAKHCMAIGMPVIVINKPHDPDELSILLSAIKQPYMLMIDEFEKIFNREHQMKMLSIFDGMITSKRLQVITCNAIGGIIEHMINRPGRFYYHFEYKGLEESFIKEYCDKNLRVGTTDEVANLAKSLDDFNFDVLQSIVEEMNRYGEPAIQVAKYLNVGMGTNQSDFTVIEFTIKDNAAAQKFVNPDKKLHCQPFGDDASIYIYDKEWEDCKRYDFTPRDIVTYKEGRVVYDTSEIRMVLQRKDKNHFNLLDLLV